MANFDLISEINLQLAAGAAKSLKDQINSSISNINVPVKVVLSKKDPKLAKLLDTTLKTIKVGLSVSNSQKSKLDFLKKTHVIPVEFNIKNADEIDKKIDNIKEKHTVSFDMKIDAGIPKKIRDIANELSAIGDNNAFITTIGRLNRVIKSFAVGAEKLAISLKEIREQAKAGGLEISLKDASRAIVRDQRQRGAKSSVLSESLSEVERLAGKTNAQSTSRGGQRSIGATGVMEDAGVFSFIDQVRQKIQKQLQDEIKQDIKSLSGINFREKYGDPGADLRATIVRAFSRENNLNNGAKKQIDTLSNTLNDIDPQVAQLLKDYIDKLDFSKSKISGIKNNQTAGAAKSNFDEIFSDLFQNPKSRSATSTTSSFFSQVEIVKSNLEKIKTLEEQVGKIEFGNVDQRTQKAIFGNISKLIEASKNELLDIVGTSDAAIRSNATTIASRVVQSLDSQIKQQKIYAGEISKTKNQIQDLKNSGLDYGKTIDLLNKKLERLSQITSTGINPIQVIREDEEIARIGRLEKIAAEAAFKIGERFKNVDISALTLGRESDLTRIFKQPKLQFAKTDTTADVREKTGEAEVRASQLLGVYKMLMSAQSELAQKERELNAQQGDITPIVNYRAAVESLLSAFRVSKDSVLQLEQSLKSLNAQFGFDLKVSSTFDKLSQSAEFAKNEIQGLVDVYKNAFSIKNVDSIINSSPLIASGLEDNLRKRASDLTNTIESIKGNTSLTSGQQQQQIKSAINQATADAKDSSVVLTGVVDRYISTLVKIDKSATDLGEVNLSNKIKEAIINAERLTLEFINAENAAERISKGKELTTAISSSSYNENLIKAVSTELRNIENLDVSDYVKTIYLIRSKINSMANGVKPLEIIKKDAEIKKMKDLELEASRLNQKIKTAIDPRVFTGSSEVQSFFESLKASSVQVSGVSSTDVKKSLGEEEKRVNDIIQLYKTLKTQRDDIDKRRTQLSTAGINTAEIDNYSNSLNNIISTFNIATGSVFDLNAQITNLYNLTQAKIGIDTQFQNIKSKSIVVGDALKELIDQYKNFSNLKAAQSIGSNTDVASAIQTKLSGIVSKLNTDIDNIINGTDAVAIKTAKINNLISLSTRQAGDIFRDVGTIDNYIKRIEILKKKASEVKLTDLVRELDSLKSGVGPALNLFLAYPRQATSQGLSDLLNGGTAKLDDIAQKITTVKNSAKSAESAYASFLNKISTKVAAGPNGSSVIFNLIKTFAELKKTQYDTAKSTAPYNNQQEYFSGLELTLKNDVAQAKELQLTVSNFLKFINNQKGFASKTGFNPFQGIVGEYKKNFIGAFKEFRASLSSAGSDAITQQSAFEKLINTLARLGGQYNATRDSITQTIKTVDTLDRSIIKVNQDIQSLSARGLDLTPGYKDSLSGGFGGTEKIKALTAKIESEKANIAKNISNSIAGGTDGATAAKTGLEQYNKLSAEFNSTVKDIKSSADEVNRLQDSITGKSAFFDANRLTQSTTALSSLQSGFDGLVGRLARGAITVTKFKEEFRKLNEAVDYASSNELKLLKYASSIDRLEASLSFDSTAVIDRTGVSSILSKLKTDIMNTPIASYSSANPSASAFDENELRKTIASQTYIIRARQAVNEEIGKYINNFDDRIFESGGSAYSQVRDVFQRGKTDLENIIGSSGTNIPGKGFNIFSGLKSDNINEFRDAVAALRKEFDKAYKTSAINALGGNIGEFAKAAGLATKRLGAFLVAASPIYAITSGMRDAITVAVDLDKQFTRLEQIIAGSSGSFDATKRSLDSLTQTILNLGKTLGVSSLEVAKSADVLAQAGIQGKKLEQVLTAVAKARLGPTFGDSAQISEAVIASFNQFEIGASKVEDLLGGISQVAAQYAVEADGITKAIRRAGGAFAAARSDGQDYFSALSEFVGTFTVLKQETREADETLATSLRNVLNRLQRSNVQKFLKEKYNINLLNEENQFKGFLPAIEEVAQKIKDLNIKSGDPRFAELIEKLSGPLQSSRLKSLLQDIGDVRKVVTDFQKGSDILDRDVSIAFGSIENKIIRAKEAVIQLFTEIARSEPVKVLVETFTLLTKSLTTVVKTLGELSQSLGAIGKIAVVAGIGATVPKLLKSKFIDTAVKYYQIGVGTNKVIGANSGGLVPGTGPNVDTEPYMLTKGEYVINRNAVSAYGKGFLDKLNAGKIKRANKGSGPGGMVGAPSGPKGPSNLFSGMISKIGGWTTVLTVGVAALGAYASSSKDASDSATALAEALAKAAVAVGVFELVNTTLKGIDFGRLKELIPQSIKDRVAGVKNIPVVGKALGGLSRFSGYINDKLSPNARSVTTAAGLGWKKEVSIPPSSIGKVLGGLAKFGKGLFIAFDLMSAYSGALAKSTDEQMKTTTSEKEALELLKKKKNLEKASTGLKVAGAAAGGAALGSMVLPGVGTAVGAVLGFLYGISDAFTDSAIYKSLSSAMSGIGEFLSTLADGVGIAMGQVGEIFSYIDEKTATAISLILGGGEKNKADENKKRKREELQVTSQANVNSLQSELKANRRAGISGLTRTGVNTLAGKNNSNSLISKTQQLYSMASTDDEKEVVKQNLESIKEIFESLTPAQKTEIINAAGDGADKLNKMFKDMDVKFDLTEEIAKASMNKVELFFMKIRTLTQNLSGLLDSVDASVESYGKMFSNIMGEPQTTAISESSFSVAKSGGQLYGPALTEFENLFKQFSNFNPEAGAAAMSEYKSASSVRKMGLDIAQGKMFGDKELGSMGGNVENLQNILVDNFTNNLGNAPKEIRDMLNEKFSQFLEGSATELQDAIGSGSVDPKKIVEVLNKFPEVADQGAIDLLKRFNESNVKFEQQLMEQTRKRLEIESKNNELLISNVDKQKSLIEFNNKASGKSDSEVNINQARNLDAQRQSIMLRGTGLGGGASTADMSNRYQQIVNQERRFGATPETQFQKDAIKKTLESVASGTDEFSASMREFEKVAERAKRSSDKLTGALLGTDEELVNSIRGAQAYQKAQSGGSASVLQMSESERKALSNYISGDEEKTLGLQKSLGIAPSMTNTPEADAVRGQIASQIEANNALISINTDLSNSIGGLSASMIQNRDAIITLSTQVNVFNQAVGNVANQFANMPKEISHKHEFYVPPITVNVTASESVNGLSPATQQMVTSLVEKKINDFATSMAGANPDITIPRGVGSPKASRS